MSGINDIRIQKPLTTANSEMAEEFQVRSVRGNPLESMHLIPSVLLADVDSFCSVVFLFSVFSSL